MAIAVAAFAFMITSLSVWGLANPSGLIAMVRTTAAGKAFLYLAVGSRVLLAALLWFAASSARHPMAFKVLAIVALVAAVVILLAGKERSLRLIEWIAQGSPAFLRVGLLLGVGFGAYLFWEIWPRIGFAA